MENVVNRQNLRAKFLSVILATILMLSVLLVVSACSSGSKTTMPATSSVTSSLVVSFSKDIQPIFNSNCVICHQGQVGAQASLTLEPKLSYSKLVDVPSTESATEMRVKAGAPDQSYLLAKLNGTQAQAGGSGAQMPYGSPPIPQDQINLVQQWIAENAPNN